MSAIVLTRAGVGVSIGIARFGNGNNRITTRAEIPWRTVYGLSISGGYRVLRANYEWRYASTEKNDKRNNDSYI